VRELHDQVVQHVQIVTFSEKVLGPLEFRTPRLAFFRKKTFDHVAEALHADPQLVPGFRTRLLGPTLVKLDNVAQLFEKQSRQVAPVHTNELRPRRETVQPALPSFATKRLQGASSLFLGAPFLLFEVRCQGLSHGAAGQPQRLQPVC
jgi:hypothetical protein